MQRKLGPVHHLSFIENFLADQIVQGLHYMLAGGFILLSEIVVLFLLRIIQNSASICLGSLSLGSQLPEKSSHLAILLYIDWFPVLQCEKTDTYSDLYCCRYSVEFVFWLHFYINESFRLVRLLFNLPLFT